MFPISVLVEILVPVLFALRVRSLFMWGRAAVAAWIVAGVMLTLSIHSIVAGTRNAELGESLLWPPCQLLWYHVLRRLTYGSWSSVPSFTLFDFRESAGTQRDRIFSVTFLLSSLVVPPLLVRLLG